MRCTGVPLRVACDLSSASRAAFGSGKPLALVSWNFRAWFGQSTAAISFCADGGPTKLAVVVGEVPLAVLLEHGPVRPPVAVEVGELLGVHVRVELHQVRHELRVGEGLFRASISFGFAEHVPDQLLRRDVLLLRRVHQLRLALLVVPHVPDVALGHRGAGVHVADDALAGRHGAGELVVDRVARLRFFGMVGSCEKLVPRLPYLAYGPEWTGDRSLAYTTWQAVQPLERVVAGVVVGAEES